MSYVPGDPRRPMRDVAEVAREGCCPTRVGCLERTTTAAERIQGRFRRGQGEGERLTAPPRAWGPRRRRRRPPREERGRGAVDPEAAEVRARIDSDSDSDHEDTRAARAKHHCAASAGAGRPAATRHQDVAADDRPADDDDTCRGASW